MCAGAHLQHNGERKFRVDLSTVDGAPTITTNLDFVLIFEQQMNIK